MNTTSDLNGQVARSLREHALRERTAEVDGSGSTAALLGIVNAALQGPLPRAPLTFGPYRLGEKVGEGSTSAVYRVLRESPEPLVLRRIKLIDPSPRAVERFTRSMRITRERLDHPNILRPLEVGAHEGQPFAIMPYLDTLERQLACEEWPPERCARVMHQLASAVAHAHERGVIHYDLKPANVLWRPAEDAVGGAPLIIDFDSARLLDPAEHDTNTWEGGGATRCYMAPELFSGGPATVRADIYSLGVIFYEMLTSELPEQAKTQHPAPAQRGSQRRPRLRVPRHFAAVCAACLAADPNERYQSAAELVRELARLLAGERPRRYEGSVRRALDWASSHRTIGIGLWGAAACSAALAWQALDPAPLSAVERSAAAASELAATLGTELEQLARAAERTARDPAVVRHLDRTSPSNLDGVLRDHVIDPVTRKAFSGSFVMTSDAQILAHYPSIADGIFEKKYPWRDYFRGAMQLGKERTAGPLGAYLGRTFRSETSERLEFGFSVPMPETGPVRGVLMTQLIAQDVLNERHRAPRPVRAQGHWPEARALLRLVLGHAEPLEQVSVLLGPRDSDRRDGAAGAPPPPGLIYLSHPDMAVRTELRLAAAYEKPLLEALGAPAPPGAQFQPSLASPVLFEEYRDPFLAGENGQGSEPSSGRGLREWSAAALPILRTGYVVLVQSNRSAPAADYRAQLLGRFGASLVGIGAVVAGLALALRRRDPLR